MESYEDDVQFPLPDRPPSPPPQPKLKRLKKSSAAAPPPPDAPPQAVSTSPATGSEQIGENVIPADDLNPVFSALLRDPRDLELEREDEEADRSRKEKSAKKRLIMEDEPGPASAVPGLEDTGEQGISDVDLYVAKAEGGVAAGSRKEKSAKKRLNMEDEADAVHASECISEKGRMEGDVDLDPLFSVPDPRDLEWEREWERESEEGLTKEKPDKAKENESDGLRKEKSAKKRLSLDDDEESPKKKKRRQAKPKPKDSVREAKRVEKERKEQLDRIHAESQRLLRETKNATFKPVSVVQKPISSILEKIRLRKLEVMRQCSLLNDSDYVPRAESLVNEDSLNADMTEPPIDAKEDHNAKMTTIDIKKGDSRVDGLEPQSDTKEDDSAIIAKIESQTDARDDDIARMAVLESQSDANKDDRTRKVDLETQSKSKEAEIVDVDVHTADGTSCKALRDPHGTAPSIKGDHNCSHLSDKDTNPSGDDQCGTSEDILVPSLSGSNSKDDSDDDLSSDEDNDKENVNPRPCRAAEMDSHPDNDNENVNPRPRRAAEMDSYSKGGLAKAFLDDEAEEEDDSDHDMMRFQENEDDESDEEEELNDLIATGFEEAPVDKEKRNQLHQKWLEQQDTAATDNVLQRLKARHKQREPALALEDDDQESEDDSEDEGSYDLPTQDGVKKSSRKAKQMFAEMFNDGNDIYVPSDDEETEQTLIRQRFLKQTVETSIVSPLDDQNSKEVFGLIKKLNVAPDFKKKGKTSTSSFDMLMMGGSSNSSSKSSFLGRTTSSSLSSSHKQGPAVRAYIFGRDDSNSRSNMSLASENVPDLGHKEDQAVKAMSTKAIGSQFKPPASRVKTDDKSGPGSLFQILRQSSAQFDKRLETRNGGVADTMTDSQVAHQFSVFKVGKKFSKVETRS